MVRASASGLIVPRSNPARLAQAIARMADDPALRAKMARMGPRFVRENYDWQQIASRYVTLLDEAIATRKRSAPIDDDPLAIILNQVIIADMQVRGQLPRTRDHV